MIRLMDQADSFGCCTQHRMKDWREAGSTLEARCGGTGAMVRSHQGHDLVFLAQLLLSIAHLENMQTTSV